MTEHNHTVSNKQRIIDAALSKGLMNPVKRSDLIAIGIEIGVPFNDSAFVSHKADRGAYNLPCGMATPAPAPAMIQSDATGMDFARQVERVIYDVASNDLVPSKIDTFVPYGNYATVRKIMKAKQFFPTYITGLSGNGKTTMIEQVCHAEGRECIRINITSQTEEDDLLGGFRLVDGETVWQDGGVVIAMERGAVLILDEVDLASHKIMCLQPVMEGRGIYLKKVNRYVKPAQGFTVFATANTKGQGGEHSDRFVGTTILNEAFLERFRITLEQDYPSAVVETRIVLGWMAAANCLDAHFAESLVKWAQIIRKSFAEGAVSEIISTRRLEHIISAYGIFHDKMESIEICVNRFPADVKEAFINLYKKVDDSVNADQAAAIAASSVANV